MTLGSLLQTVQTICSNHLVAFFLNIHLSSDFAVLIKCDLCCDVIASGDESAKTLLGVNVKIKCKLFQG